ncbi:MAG: phosphatase [Streptomycetales bacterium]
MTGRGGGSVTRPPERAELRAHLLRHRIAGRVATPRENNLRNYRLMSARDPHYLFGLEPEGRWPPEDVLALMADRVGVSPDPAYRSGQDTIDPDRTVDRLDEMAARLGKAAQGGQRVVVATGHPTGLMPVHRAVAAALAAAGCAVLTPDAAAHYEGAPGEPAERVEYVDRVAVLSSGAGGGVHTHEPEPMRAILASLRAAGERLPDLVVADHGWAGAAGQAGIDAVGFADCNDPALFVGEAEGAVEVAVPLDDNVAPHLYDPLTAYLLDHAGL